MPTVGHRRRRDAGALLASPSCSCLQLHVCGLAPVTRPPDPAFGPCFAVPHSSWSRRLPPPTPLQIAPLCSPASQVLSTSVTSSSRASSATASGLPDAALGTTAEGRTKISRFPHRRCAYMLGVHVRGGWDGALAIPALTLLPSHCHAGIGPPDYIASAARSPAYTPPCQRFAGTLAGTCA